MTSQEMLDRFSEVLLTDERILSASERQLLTSVLRNAAGSDSAIAIRAVSNAVAERAFSVLGESLVAKLMNRFNPAKLVSTAPPRPPGPTPPSPGGSPPAPPGPGIYAQDRVYDAPPRPPGPTPPSPQGVPPPPPGPGVTMALGEMSSASTAVLEAPDFLPADCVVLDEFLSPAELQDLLRYALERQDDFRISEVICPGADSRVDFDHRRSRVLLNPDRMSWFGARVSAILPRVCSKLNYEPFPVRQVETQITASNDGDFFHCHSDNSDAESAGREITFVYFFHREPKLFRGGELRIYDSRRENDCYVPTANYRIIVPRQNQLVLFASSLAHEITLVDCPSRAFADSRFTVNGWLHR